MSDTDKEVALFQPTDASSDALLRECSATAVALNQVYGLPPIVERMDTQFSLTLVGRADRLFNSKTARFGTSNGKAPATTRCSSG